MLRYVGDSKRLRSRVRQHCKGNVESSALRKTIAAEMGFDIISKKLRAGKRLNLADRDLSYGTESCPKTTTVKVMF